MTQVTTRPAVVNPRLRLLDGDWTLPHVHRYGPVDELPAQRVLDLLASLPHWEPPKNAVRASQLRMRRRGAGQILDWLASIWGRAGRNAGSPPAAKTCRGSTNCVAALRNRPAVRSAATSATG